MAVFGHSGLSERCICARPGAKADKKAKGTAEALASEPCLPEGWVRTILSVMADKNHRISRHLCRPARVSSGLWKPYRRLLQCHLPLIRSRPDLRAFRLWRQVFALLVFRAPGHRGQARTMVFSGSGMALPPGAGAPAGAISSLLSRGAFYAAARGGSSALVGDWSSTGNVGILREWTPTVPVPEIPRPLIVGSAPIVLHAARYAS